MSDASESTRQQAKRHPRSDYRNQSHLSVHARELAPAQPIPDHPLIPKTAPAMISSPDGLMELIDHIRSVGSFAYDSEFIGEMSYLPKLCLIQVATAQRVALVDSLAKLDLTEFWKLIADASIEKVVHCGQQDLEPIFRHLSQPPARIFDTQVAAGFIGLAYPVGLSKLVRELTGVHLGKGFTFTHWDQRPLSNVQIRYAADDVRYLPAVRQAIGKRLETLGHMGWVEEECAGLCDPALYRMDEAADFMRIRGANALSPQGLALLRELYLWRESAARTQDTPPRSYLRDEVLVDMSRKPVTAVEGLAKVRGLPRPVEISEGVNMVAATQRGLAVPETQRPAAKQTEETPTERFGIDSLWAVVQAWSAGQGVDPALVSSRQEIARLYREVRAQASPAQDGRLMHGWRGQLIGKRLREFLGGGNLIQLGWKEGALRSSNGMRG